MHGEMLLALIQSGISSYPHRTVVMQFFETVVRYSDFFRIRKECIMPTLEAMVDTRCLQPHFFCCLSLIVGSLCSGIHNESSIVRARAYYLFHRFVKELKSDLPI